MIDEVVDERAYDLLQEMEDRVQQRTLPPLVEKGAVFKPVPPDRTQQPTVEQKLGKNCSAGCENARSSRTSATTVCSASWSKA